MRVEIGTRITNGVSEWTVNVISKDCGLATNMENNFPFAFFRYDGFGIVCIDAYKKISDANKKFASEVLNIH